MHPRAPGPERCERRDHHPAPGITSRDSTYEAVKVVRQAAGWLRRVVPDAELPNKWCGGHAPAALRGVVTGCVVFVLAGARGPLCAYAMEKLILPNSGTSSGRPPDDTPSGVIGVNLRDLP